MNLFRLFLPRSLTARVYSLYALSMLVFVSLGLGLLYAYKFTQEIEDTKDSSAILVQVVGQTVNDSAVIGDFDTIKRTLELAVRKSSFESAVFIDTSGATVKTTARTQPRARAPDWLKEQLATRLYGINLPVVVGDRDYGVLRFYFDIDVIAGNVWWFTRYAALLALASLAGGLMLIFFPLRAWLGTLDRVQAFERELLEGKIDAGKVLDGDVPAEFRATFDVLSRTARSLREQLSAKENALKSLQALLQDIAPAEDKAVTAASGDDIEALSLQISRLVAEREEGRRALDNQKYALDQHAIVSIADRDQKLTYVNNQFCEFTGYTREELLGHRTFEVLALSEETKKTTAEMLASLQAGKVWKNDVSTWTKSGELRWLNTTIVPLLGPDGKPVEFISIRTDITARKAVESDLQRAIAIAEAANRSKGDFLANMSHEIRTPMNAVIGMTHLALDTEDRDEQQDYMRTVQSSAESLLSVINDILDFSKIEAGKLTMEKIPFSFRGTLGDSLKGLASRAQEKNLELVLDVDGDIPETLIGDPGRLRQVITNLAGNAIKFTEQGEVVLSVHLENTGATAAGTANVRIAIRDSGIGIPQAKHASVFESFIQEDTSTTRRFGGTGLGLPISSRLVSMMGGKIELDSTVGKGSTFHFCIPLGIGSAPTPAPVAAELAGRSALVVDDNATNRGVLEGMLRRWGMTVRTAASGAESLAALASAPADVVLLDGRMPGMDGFETASATRKQGTTTRMAMLSSVGMKGDAARCRELGITGYLTKPVDRGELLSMLKRMLAMAPGETGQLVTRHALRDENEQARRGATPSTGTSAPLQGDAVSLDVLLVEDHPVNRTLALKLLQRWGHRVTTAEDGAKALEQMRAHRFDAVLMDLQMPVMGGLEATRIWRSEETDRRLPIIAITASAMVSDYDACIAAGIDDYIAKPFDQTALRNLLDRLVPRRSAPVT